MTLATKNAVGSHRSPPSIHVSLNLIFSTVLSMPPLRLVVLAALTSGMSSAMTIGRGLPPALAEQARIMDPMEFPAGSSVKRLTGTIQGGQRSHYLFEGKAGKDLSVGITASICHTFFTISAAKDGSNLFVGEEAGILFEGKLPKTGQYLITVYLAQGSSHDGAISRYDLTIQELAHSESRPRSSSAFKNGDAQRLLTPGRMPSPIPVTADRDRAGRCVDGLSHLQGQGSAALAGTVAGSLPNPIF